MKEELHHDIDPDMTGGSQRYINFYTDFAFKKLFGTEMNKDLLISFLNSLFAGSEVITDLHYLNVEHMGAAAAERKAVFDVYCENDRGEKFLIEMQKAEQEYFIDRSIYYSTFPIQEQAPKGKWNFRLSKVYTIGILNFCFSKDDPEYMHHEVKLMDTRTKEVFYDKLAYIYLEMPKFRKSVGELDTLFDKWLFALKNLSRLLERPDVLQEQVFLHLFEQAEIAKLSPTELHDYRESQKDAWDIYSVVESAEHRGEKKGREEGRAEGLEEGRAKGIAESRLEIARSMKDNGIETNVIASCTGLNLDEILSL